MTRDDIINMAREAGFPFNKYGLLQGDDDGEIDADEMFARLATLVAAKEREACAQACEAVDEPAWLGYECPNTFKDGTGACADAIRARSTGGAA